MSEHHEQDTGGSVPRYHMAIWFGDGGVGKSLIALYVAGKLAAQGLRVLYLDWELDQGEHRLRYEQIFGEAMPTECSSGAVTSRCGRPAIRFGAKFGNIGLTMPSSTRSPTRRGAGAETSDTAVEYANVVRSLGIGSLHLAHITKGGDAAKLKPFGSNFWHASARSTWYFENERATEGPDFNVTDLALYHCKSNFSPLEKEPRRVQYTIGKNEGYSGWRHDSSSGD